VEHQKPKRLIPLDTLRGLIIVFMALDHASYFVAQQHASEQWGGPFPAYDSAFAFLTRLVTHFCAPGFFFLMGVGMLLLAESRRQKGWDTWKILSHFWLRSGILILLQLLIVNFIWKAGPFPFPTIYIGVLIALGGTMMLGSLVLRQNPVVLIILTLGMLIGTELLHPDPSAWGHLFIDLPNMLMARTGGDGYLWSNYPILPWLELVIFGFLFGRWLLADEIKAYQKGLWIGFALLVGFVVIRALDGFGNIRPRAGNSWIDFLNMVKYPPSMVFTFFTMGINLILLWAFSKSGKIIQVACKPLAVFGRAPLFMYVLHLALYMILGKLFTPHGTSLAIMYPFWLAGLLLLYPLARWYGDFKRRQPPQSILRFF